MNEIRTQSGWDMLREENDDLAKRVKEQNAQILTLQAQYAHQALKAAALGRRVLELTDALSSLQRRALSVGLELHGSEPGAKFISIARFQFEGLIAEANRAGDILEREWPQ